MATARTWINRELNRTDLTTEQRIELMEMLRKTENPHKDNGTKPGTIHKPGRKTRYSITLEQEARIKGMAKPAAPVADPGMTLDKFIEHLSEPTPSEKSQEELEPLPEKTDA